MKKKIITIIAGTILLLNVVFVVDKNTNANINKNHGVSSANQIRLQTDDPDGW
ncbi:hypothetical protein [Clostridium sp. HBUAS56017]|uniref:hypothetical protein n=1 Tax=Clostridium sp. HBUAS56017 TaxID=2571128 RepID=UPI00163DDAD1|nr:hypothetical protein [Clostridium sp. HBUAS56017]